MLLLSKCNTVKAEQPDMSGKFVKLLDWSIIFSIFRNSPNDGSISNWLKLTSNVFSAIHNRI